MRSILVCTGVLGGGTALVFALAAATATLFPQGTLVGGGWNGGVMMDRAWGGGGVAVPVPAPAIMAPQVIVPDGAGAVPSGGFQAMPGDTVVTGSPVPVEASPAP